MIKGTFEGERSLFKTSNETIDASLFQNGESPLKECKGLKVLNSTFLYKYPLWYGKDITCFNSYFLLDAHAGFWYGVNYDFSSCYFGANKSFRRNSNLTLKDSIMLNSSEAFWFCSDLLIKNTYINGDYAFLGSKNIILENVYIKGNYPFDSACNVTLKNCILLSKDAFWNCKNVSVYDSIINGEYIGWNSTSLNFFSCKISSHQGFCYIDKLFIKDSNLYGGDLMFEYCSNIDIQANSKIKSVKNPISGKIASKGIEELIQDDLGLDKNKVSYEQI